MPAWSLTSRSADHAPAPIGVFDSGHGGLTILRGLVDRLPRQRFIYLGDHAHAPYGQRPAQEILDFTRSNVERLFDLGCRLVILACNTAAAVALRRLQQDWLPAAHADRRILGVLVPMVEALARTNWYAGAPSASASPQRAETVAVFATPATIAAGAYQHEVQSRAPWIRVVPRACPELAGLIERDAGDAAIGPAVAAHVAALLDELRQSRMADADSQELPLKAVLGCTHYPLIQHLFRAALPAETEILSQPRRVAESLTAYLWRHPEFRHFEMEPTAPLCFTTGDAARISVLASRFFGGHLDFQPLG
ncbi:MAG: glutamate racemase [Dongiaceae bacterium]